MPLSCLLCVCSALAAWCHVRLRGGLCLLLCSRFSALYSSFVLCPLSVGFAGSMQACKGWWRQRALLLAIFYSSCCFSYCVFLCLFNAKVQNYFVGCLLFAAYFRHSAKPLVLNDLRGDDLRRCKRCSFAVQKVAFWRVKDGLSQCKIWPFVERLIFCVISLSCKRIYVCDFMMPLISMPDYLFSFK